AANPAPDIAAPETMVLAPPRLTTVPLAIPPDETARYEQPTIAAVDSTGNELSGGTDSGATVSAMAETAVPPEPTTTTPVSNTVAPLSVPTRKTDLEATLVYRVGRRCRQTTRTARHCWPSTSVPLA